MSYYFLLALLLFFYMNFWFLLSLLIKRNDIADIAWGLGFALLAWCSYFTSPINTFLSIIVNLLVTIWGLRLAWHIYLRNRRKKEDYRYQEWRKQWGKGFLIRSYFQVYLFQGLFLYLIVFSVIFINHNPDNNLILPKITGLIIWIVGFLF